MGLWRPTHGSPREACPPHPPCRGSAGLSSCCPQLVVTSLETRQGRGDTAVSSVYVLVQPRPSISHAPTTCVAPVRRALVCPLSFRTDFQDLGTTGCQTALWPWDARGVVPASRSVLPALGMSVCLAVGGARRLSSGSGARLRAGVLNPGRLYMFTKDFNLYILSLTHLKFPFI